MSIHRDESTVNIRLEKLQNMQNLGCDPYREEKFAATHSTQELYDQFDQLSDQEIRAVGRIVAVRVMGKAAFLHISENAVRYQCYLKKNEIGDNAWEIFKNLDIGDHLGVTGKLFTTKTGEKTIHVSSFTPLSKCFHILPLGKEKDGEQWYGLSNVENRYRHRNLDLICNSDSREVLINRSKIISAVRRFLEGRDFLEVETPLLQLVAGGAAAKPFLTHYNAYDINVKLRISLELYLKRLICGDIRRVYEIGRVFRNKGVSNRHNPEFTMLEYYEAFVNLEDMMESVESMFKYVTQEVFGSTTIETADGTLDFSKPWKRVDLLESIEQNSGIKPEVFESLKTAKKAMEDVGLPTKEEYTIGGILEKLLERFVEPTLIEPTFVVNYPVETSPLAKRHPDNPLFTRRFEGYIRGREICNSFSELNNPLDQRERFEEQSKQRFHGNEEAHPMDEDFLYAMECGMPPTGGCGIGLDRMAMILTGCDSLREVLMFPMMKPEITSGL